ncbi:type II toxin-antitoxin system YafQ family toxin [Candidatus Dependentiae bacterium]|nr:type II toxin-antitoxin system YafQ family toxin [Candidatus Dependentiae bacterium]
MLRPIYTRIFEKEVVKAKKRGKDLEKLKTIITLLLEEKPLPIKNRNHRLQGDFKDCWECHIEPDLLLIYQKSATEIIFLRVGTHSDLF